MDLPLVPFYNWCEYLPYPCSPDAVPNFTAFHAEVQMGGSWVNYGHRGDTRLPAATSHRRGKFEDHLRRAVQEGNVRLEDALVHLQLQLNGIQQQLDVESRWAALSKRQMKEYAYAEILRGNLTVLNEGTREYLQNLTGLLKRALVARLGRASTETDDYFTLVRSRHGLEEDETVLDRALRAGERRLADALAKAKTELVWQGEAQTEDFPDLDLWW